MINVQDKCTATELSPNCSELEEIIATLQEDNRKLKEDVAACQHRLDIFFHRLTTLELKET